MDLETQLRLSVLAEDAKQRGWGWEDFCVAYQVKDRDDRRKIRALFLRSSEANEARAAGVAGHIESTGCPIIERDVR